MGVLQLAEALSVAGNPAPIPCRRLGRSLGLVLGGGLPCITPTEPLSDFRAETLKAQQIATETLRFDELSPMGAGDAIV